MGYNRKQWKRVLVIILAVLVLFNTITVLGAEESQASDEFTSSAVPQESQAEEPEASVLSGEELTDPETEGESAGIGTESENESSSDLESTETESEEEPIVLPTVRYQTHVQTYGWQSTVSDGAVSGTIGQAKRLEGIRISIEDTDYSGSIQYQTHVQSYGWQKAAADGEMSGTAGQAKRLEGIKIWLTGELAEKFDIYYRVHAQTFGWLDWAKNGELSGTTGLAKRLEAIQIILVEKGGEAPGSTERTSASLPSVTYQAHAQTHGWLDWVSEGAACGTTGEKKRLEAVAIKLTGDTNLSGNIEYRTHVQSFGWQSWSRDGAVNGTTGKAKRVEALQIRLTGELANVCDVYYRVHVEGYGWLGWAKNGEMAGTSGLALRVEALEIRIGAKSGVAPVVTGTVAYHEYTGPGYYQIGSNRYYYIANGVRSGGNGWQRIGGNRYYAVNGIFVTGWQYIDGYKYYFNPDGSLCQNVDGIIGVQSTYQIRINKQANCVTIYARDGVNGYVIPVRSMLCSTGDDTPLGTLKTLGKYRWANMINGTYAQYATRLTPVPGVLFHSITYSVKGDIRSMIPEGYNGLGTIRSLGCIRLVCGDAYWLYQRCAVGTTVIVYNDANPGPFDRPVVAPIPVNQTWDPTDPNL